MNNHFEKKYLYYTDSVQVYVAWEELTGVKVLKVSYFYKYQKSNMILVPVVAPSSLTWTHGGVLSVCA